jgi:hypothetical protein
MGVELQFPGDLGGELNYTPGVLSSRCLEPSVNGEITRITHFFYELEPHRMNSAIHPSLLEK